MLATALVILHHAAITYGASGGWYWHERPSGSIRDLTLFVTMNQAWFMGLFFLLAGFLTPDGYHRKGPRRFMADRLRRLGLPLLVFAVVLDPLTNSLAAGGNPLPGWASRIASASFHPGPLWFVEALLAFSAVYAVLRGLGTAAPLPRKLPSDGALLAAACTVGAAAFLIRLAYPVDRTWHGLIPGYFASYVVLFAAGILAAPSDWLGRVSARQALLWSAVSVAAFVALLISDHLPGPPVYGGGWTIKAAFYAIWEPFFAWGMMLGLLYLSRRIPPSLALGWTARRAFGCYVIHPPILVALARSLQGWTAAPELKTLAAGSLTCLACLAVNTALLRIPAVARVL